MTTPLSSRTAPRPFDLRRATGVLLLLTGSSALGLTTYWLGSGTRSAASATAGAASPGGVDDQDWGATTDDDGWAQAAPQATYSARPQGPARGWSRGS